MSGKNFMSFGDADTILTEFSNDIKSRVSTKANQGLTAQQQANAKANIGIENVPNVATNDQTPTFLEESTRNNIASGDKLSLIFGKIKKFFSDLKPVAFSGSYNDLDDTPDLSLKADKSLLEEGNAHFQFGVDANGNYGYHKTVGGADTVIPFKTVGTRSGAITANGTYTAKTDISKDGYESVTVSVSPNLQSKTVTAGTANVTVSPDASYDGLSSVVVQPTPSQTKSVTPSTSAQTVSPDSGKLLSSVSVGAISTQEKTVTSSRSAQTVTPDSGKYLSKVTVNALAPTGTYPASSRGASLDMGATSNYRYVNTNNVPNSNSGTYTVQSGADGLDMGATNSYRYVNAKSLWISAHNSRLKSLWTNTSPNSGFSTKDITIANSYNFSDFQYIFIRFKLTTSLTQYEQIVGINMSNYTKYTISVTNIGSIANVVASAVINGSHTVWRPIVYLNSKQLRIERPIVNIGKSDGSVYMVYQTSGTHHGYVIPLELLAVDKAS